MNPRPINNAGQLARFAAMMLAMLFSLSVFGQQTTPEEETTAEQDGNVVVLSPFIVSTERDTGYFAANTLAGSRMNTNISDLGASISVITKQEMEDTASVDMNDVFRYQVNTEGSSTYTPATLAFRSDGFLDVNAGGTQGNSLNVFSNATANRVRGLGVPTQAINYYPSIGQIPLDAYNVSSIEISRGPNSMLFGLGSPAGIVNQSTAQANLSRTTASISVRVDDRESLRGSLDFNIPLIKDKFGIYGALLWNGARFERKPSYDDTQRQYLTFTYKPFSKTTIRASIEGYENDNRRPNTLTPRDFITEWNTAGQPAYNPLNRTITAGGQVRGNYVLNASSPYAQEVRDYIMSLPNYNPALHGAGAWTSYNGVNIFGQGAATTAGTFVAGGAASNNALFVPGIGWSSNSRTVFTIADGALQSWYQSPYNITYRTAWGTATNPAANAPLFPTAANIWANPTWSDIFNRDSARSAGWTGIGNGIIGYKYPGVTDKSIYNWEKININEPNFGHDENINYNVELEQQLLDNLFLSAGWFRQDFESATNYTVAQLSATTLFVDASTHLPDGTINPYFGKPFVEDFDPDQYVTEILDDHYRAMLAWTPDFSQRDDIFRWLGRHQILGLWSRDESMTATYRRRLQFISSTSDAGRYRYLPNANNNADGSPTGWNRGTGSLMRRSYYLAQPSDPNGVVTRSSGEWNTLNFTGDLRAYDYAANGWTSYNMTTEFVNIDAGTGRNQRIVDSISGGMTSYLWNERLIATFGVRKDKFKARSTNTALPAVLDADGNVLHPAITNVDKWVDGVFQTEPMFDRWGRWDPIEGTTRTYGGVLRPFQNWNSIDRHADEGSLFWGFIRDFGFSYNKSNNFNPPPSAQGDIFGNPLPKPEGEGEDYGIQFSLFENKLFARVTWFKASNLNERTSPGTTISRLEGNIDTTLFRNWARTIAKINLGMNPTLPGFNDALTPAVETQVQDAAAVIWQQPYQYYDSLPFARGATRNAEAEGIEAELNYNPTRNWTMKFTFGKQDTKYSNVLTQFTEWFNVRNPIWQAAQASDFLLPQYASFATYVTDGGRPVDLTNFWTSYGFTNEVRLDEPNGNYNVEAYYNINVTPQILLARDLEGQSSPGQRKYRWSFLTTYTFDEGRLKGFFVGGSQRWEDKSIIGYYGRASGANGTSLDVSDITRPIYDDANSYTDLWVGYRRKVYDDKVMMTLRLNVVDVFESGRLQTVGVNYDGSPYAFRIVDPRQIIFSAKFDF